MAAVSYDPKVASFLDDLKQGSYLDYAELTTAEALCALVDTVACADREALRAATERVMEMESRNVETAQRLLESGE
jgi:polysaccharide pyruvyl transferase WcaK-like protein